MERISIVGTSGSGKTTLGKALASVLGIPHVELDALNLHFVTKDSMLLWVIKTHGKMRRRYRELFQHPDLAQVRKIELKSPGEVDIFLRGLIPADMVTTVSSKGDHR